MICGNFSLIAGSQGHVDCKSVECCMERFSTLLFASYIIILYQHASATIVSTFLLLGLLPDVESGLQKILLQ